MSFLDVIKVKYNDLTESEKKVADYIVKDSDAILTSNAKKIGELTGTSGATVVRFCKKINIESLEALKLEIARNTIAKGAIDEIDPILQKGDSLEQVVSKVYFQVDTALKRTLDLINYDGLQNVITKLRNAENIYIYGIGASSLAAYDLYHKLNRVNKRAFYNFDGHMNLEFSVHAKPNDVAIAFSYSGNSLEINKAIEKVKENGAEAIAIVQNGSTPLSKLVDHCLEIPNNEKRVRMGSVSSKFAQMLFVDILYFGIVGENLDEVFEYIKKTSGVVDVLKEK